MPDAVTTTDPIRDAALRWAEEHPLGDVTPRQHAIASALVGKLLRQRVNA